MAANQTVLQLTQQTGSANTTTVYYGVINGSTDTGLPHTVLVNNIGLTGVPTAPTAATADNSTTIASTAYVQSNLTSYAKLASPTFTGVPLAPTAANGTSTTQLATTAFVAGTFAAPPSYGSTTPNAVHATTISATGLISPTSTIGIAGTTTNDSAPFGSVGEYVSNTTLTTSITTGTVTNATSISLTAGDWDVSGVARFNPAGTTILSSQATGVSPTSATSAGFGTVNSLNFATAAGIGCQLVAPVARITLSATTTIFLIVVANFTVSTCTADGFIRARRVR